MLLHSALLVVVVTFLCCSCTAEAASGYVVLPADSNSPTVPVTVKETRLPAAGGPKNDGILAIFSNAAPHFEALTPYGGHPCNVRTKTSETAKHAGCSYATNGGPFDMSTGQCSGVTVTNGKVVTDDFSHNSGFFGVTLSGDWILGDISNSSIIQAENITNGLSSFGWLVRDGASVPPVGGEVAPRTAIGVDSSGRLILFTVDGCEKCVTGDQGLTLSDLAKMMIAHGAKNAMNLDGGGSTTAYANGTVINNPTCTDVRITCERTVTTIVCIK
eukprot:m.227573 g.227573  ORF g.227573 m.227573 type:complete len:273 (-) comp19246_c0_seq2:87-905(-)